MNACSDVPLLIPAACMQSDSMWQWHGLVALLTTPPPASTPSCSTFIALCAVCGARAVLHPGAVPWWREWAAAAASCLVLLYPMRWAPLSGPQLARTLSLWQNGAPFWGWLGNTVFTLAFLLLTSQLHRLVLVSCQGVACKLWVLKCEWAQQARICPGGAGIDRE